MVDSDSSRLRSCCVAHGVSVGCWLRRMRAKMAGLWAWDPVPPHACLTEGEAPAVARAIDELAEEWVERWVSWGRASEPADRGQVEDGAGPGRWPAGTAHGLVRTCTKP